MLISLFKKKDGQLHTKFSQKNFFDITPVIPNIKEPHCTLDLANYCNGAASGKTL